MGLRNHEGKDLNVCAWLVDCFDPEIDYYYFAGNGKYNRENKANNCVIKIGVMSREYIM